MEFQKIVNILDTTSDDKDLPRSVTKKRIVVFDQSGGNFKANKEIRIKTSMLRSSLCDYTDEYIIVEGDITLEGDNDANKRNKNLAMYNLREYSKNYRKTTRSLWNYRDEPSNPLSSNSE